jgi:hypothetical protein
LDTALGAFSATASDAVPWPNKSKPGQAHPNKIAWICLVLFVRIGTYQRLTAIPNKNFSLLALSPSAPSKPAPRSDECDRVGVSRFSQEDDEKIWPLFVRAF